MRLATRLSLSYIGFLALLGFLVLVLVVLQVNRLGVAIKHLPTPASPHEAGLIADYLAENGLQAPIPATWLSDTLQAGGWVQVLDAQGLEVASSGAPADRRTAYGPVDLAALADPYRSATPSAWAYTMAPIGENQGLVMLVAPLNQAITPVWMRLTPPAARAFGRYFLSGIGMAVVTAVLLALLAGFWYARRLARPLARLSAELKSAAAGDFSHRIPVKGQDEFAVLTGAYNHLMERLDEAQRERNRVEQARQDLVANISHDLRTPLTSIQGFTETLADPATPPVARERYIRLIADRVGALDAMLADLLELSRLQAIPAIHKEPVDLPELVREQVIALMPQIEQAGLAVEVDLPDENALPPVAADARLIGRALQNLLVNALRHSEGATHLGVSVWTAGDGVTIAVADDGRGIPPADLPNLFERYYQGTSATNARKGSGLGLAIVKQIAENHGGWITVASAEGRGTTFSLWLPV